MGSGLVRILIIGLVIWLVFRLIAYARRRYQAEIDRRARPAMARVLPCDKCGVHVPEDQAVRLGDRVYCDEHRPSQ